MVSIKDLSYKQDFYWNGVRYRQLIRPKCPRGPFKIYACDVSVANYGAIEMPSCRKVKPVMRVINAST